MIENNKIVEYHIWCFCKKPVQMTSIRQFFDTDAAEFFYQLFTNISILVYIIGFSSWWKAEKLEENPGFKRVIHIFN